MKVNQIWQSRTEQPLTSPFPIADGLFFALRSGDLCSPDSWREPKHVRRAWLRVPRPFIAYREGDSGFYIGWKVFGVDGEHLKVFPSINPAEVRPGSVAMQGFTWRFSRKIGD